MEIKEQIMLFAKEQQVFTFDEIVRKFDIKKEDRAKFGSVLQRLCKNNRLYRYEKGVYGYEAYSPMFDVTSHLPVEEAIARLYLKNDEGYISGADFNHMIGLSSWCPAKKTIVSNKVCRTTQKCNLLILPSKTVITKHNKDYLKLLDCIETLDELSVDAPTLYQIIMGYIEKKGMNVQTLISLSEKHYKSDNLYVLLECLGR